MNRTHAETRWVIVGRYGLYSGQWIRRKDAIIDHCLAKGIPRQTVVDGPIWLDRPRDEAEIKKAWQHWRAKGDRVIKARITWKERTR